MRYKLHATVMKAILVWKVRWVIEPITVTIRGLDRVAATDILRSRDTQQIV